MTSSSRGGSLGPLLVVLLALLVLWYLGAVIVNWPGQVDYFKLRDVTGYSFIDVLYGTMTQAKPLLPAPHQLAVELWNTVFNIAPTSKKSLVYHGWITLSATLLGFAFGTGLGILLAVFIVHNRATDRSLMPWIIASQTVPILAIAPMVIVVLNAVGISGLIPKALISTYLSFFPVVVGMVKGFRSPEQLQLDLMRTYSASNIQVFFKLRWPIALPYLFTSMKVAVAASLVGAIVGELPAGGGVGLGARLLAGSYYGQTIQIWSALIVAAALAGSLVFIVGVSEGLVVRRMGARPA
jgi:NitT/TauT family transport system permease protein